MKVGENSFRREPAAWRGRLGWGKTAAAEHNTMRGRSASCDVAVTVCWRAKEPRFLRFMRASRVLSLCGVHTDRRRNGVR